MVDFAALREGARQQQLREPGPAVGAEPVKHGDEAQPAAGEQVHQLAAGRPGEEGEVLDQVGGVRRGVAHVVHGPDLGGRGEAVVAAEVGEGGGAAGDGVFEGVAADNEGGDGGDEEGEEDGAADDEEEAEDPLRVVGRDHVAVAERREGDDCEVEGDEVLRVDVAVPAGGVHVRVVPDEPVPVLAVRVGGAAAAQVGGGGGDVCGEAAGVGVDDAVPDAGADVRGEEEHAAELGDVGAGAGEGAVGAADAADDADDAEDADDLDPADELGEAGELRVGPRARVAQGPVEGGAGGEVGGEPAAGVAGGDAGRVDDGGAGPGVDVGGDEAGAAVEAEEEVDGQVGGVEGGGGAGGGEEGDGEGRFEDGVDEQERDEEVPAQLGLRLDGDDEPGLLGAGCGAALLLLQFPKLEFELGNVDGIEGPCSKVLPFIGLSSSVQVPPDFVF